MVEVYSKIKWPDDANNFLLSPHFKARELQCRCCKKIIIIPRLLNALETTRERVDHPILISNGCRCQRYQRAIYERINTNRKLLGFEPIKAPRVGYHITCEAIDTPSIVVPGERGSPEEVAFLEQLRRDGWVGIGIQRERRDEKTGEVIQVGFTHMDVRLAGSATWYYGPGRFNG